MNVSDVTIEAVRRIRVDSIVFASIVGGCVQDDVRVQGRTDQRMTSPVVGSTSSPSTDLRERSGAWPSSTSI